MSEHNYNTIKQKIHNPKSFAPAVYIPAWLSQVPSKELPYSCKLVYGRLAQWANAQGKAYRSAKNLSCELGIPQRTIEHSIDKLKKCCLIGSFQPYEGGKSHYQFYDHEWMYRPLDKNLCYESDNFSPSANIAEPSANIAEHKIRINKKNKKNKVANINKDNSPANAGETHQLTEEAKNIIAIWNLLAVNVGCPSVGNNKRQLKAIQKNLRVVKQKWEVVLSAETFEIMLTEAINNKFYLLTKYYQTLDVFLRWHNFEAAYLDIQGVKNDRK